MTAVPDRSTFESIYTGQALWDIGKPQQAFLGVADRITRHRRERPVPRQPVGRQRVAVGAAPATRSRASTSSKSQSPGPGGRQPSGA
jgi:hypothetical protein